MIFFSPLVSSTIRTVSLERCAVPTPLGDSQSDERHNMNKSYFIDIRIRDDKYLHNSCITISAYNSTVGCMSEGHDGFG